MSLELLRSCVIDALIPRSADLTLEELLNDAQSAGAADDSPALAPRAPQRETVFLDERISSCVVLRCPLIEEHLLKDLLSQILITVEAFAVGTAKGADGQDAPKTGIKDLLDSYDVDETEDPMVAVGSERNGKEEEGEEQSFIYVMWKQVMHLARTNIRTTNPSLYLSATAKLKSTSMDIEDTEEEYMTPYKADSVNLFHALQHDPSFKGRKPPVLSAARLSKHTPSAAATKEQPRPLKNLTRTLHPLLPVVNTRLRSNKLGGLTTRASGPARMLASLDVEMSTASGLPIDQPLIQLEKMDVELENGEARALPSVDLPRKCYAGDLISFVYDLIPDEEMKAMDVDDSATLGQAITLGLDARIVTDENGRSDERLISASLRTILDLSALYRPSRSKLKTYPITVTIESVSKDPLRVDEILKWTLVVSNTTASPPRALRLKIVPMLEDSVDGPDVVAVKPWVTTPVLRPGSSTTLLLEFKMLREGILRAAPLRLIEIDGNGHEIKGISSTIGKEHLPEVVALSG